MSIIPRAIEFLRGLIERPRRPSCPSCGSSLWKKHGIYYRGRRCLDELNLQYPLQRYRCLAPGCGKTWSEQPPWLAPRRWYGRDVIRMSLDLCLDCTTSWREVQSLVHGVLTGEGRALRWAPWRRPKEGADQVKLAHTTLWRWFQDAAKRANAPETVADRYGGLFSGVLATDESWGWLKGMGDRVGQKVGFGIQGLVDGMTRLVLRLRRLLGESEDALRMGVEQLAARGIDLAALRVWLSDGLQTYAALLAMLDLGALPRQRSLFHLWRNVAGGVHAYAEANGQEAAAALKGAMRAVWDAPSERAAVVALLVLVRAYGHDPLAGPVVRLVRTTFKEATLHLKGLVAGLPRTTGVVEWVWRRYKRRMRLIQCFMSEEGADHFLALYELYVNFHRYQVRKERKRSYPYPGQCPLEIAGVGVDVEVGGRRGCGIDLW
jgi:hypothetical protein